MYYICKIKIETMTKGEVQRAIISEIDRLKEEITKSERVDYLNGLNLALSNLYIALSNTLRQ